MSQIKVDSITPITGSDPISFPTGIIGVGTYLTFAPTVETFSPEPFAVGVSTSTNIVFTFDQNIQFTSPSGTIQLRKDSASGTVIESYTTGSSARLSITNNTLTIDPTSNLINGETYFVILPSTGIGNTFGNTYGGTNTYSFSTEELDFSVSGGTHVFTRSDPGSPTGFYKYHVFTSTGPLSLTSPSLNATNAALLMVAGGGGGGSYSSNYDGGGGGAGGLVYQTNFLLEKGSYTVTIGAGGGGQSPTNTSYGRRGQDTKIASSPTVNQFIAFGGGGGSFGPTNPEAPGGSGGGLSAGYTINVGGYGYLGQGNNGRGGLTSIGPGSPSVSGGGGGANTEGLEAVATPSPTGLKYRSGAGGSGRPITAFSSPILSGNAPTIPSPSLTKIGPTGLYAGGGGGGAGPTPTAPAGTFTAGAGGPGGGGHGSFVDPTFSPFSPSTPTQYIAESGYQNTGGGGGGSTGPYSSYPGGNGGSGVVMIRYSVPS